MLNIKKAKTAKTSYAVKKYGIKDSAAQSSYKDTDTLGRIKKHLKDGINNFTDNIERYREFTYFTCVNNLTQDQKGVLQDIQKAPLQFNINEAYINKRLGEFSRSEQFLTVSAAPGVDAVDNPVLTQQIDTVEGHLRYTMLGSYNNNMRYHIYKNQIVGGFGVGEVYVDFVNEDSFEQQIYNKCHENPCSVFFDPQAKEPHKGDGEYCFDISYLDEHQLRVQFGDSLADEIINLKSADTIVAPFNWSFTERNEKLYCVIRYFQKNYRSVRKVQIADNPITGPSHVMDKKDYNAMLKLWDSTTPPPGIIRERTARQEYITEYILAGGTIVEEKESIYPCLPLVFFDGNSENTTSTAGSTNFRQYTRPINYQGRDLQMLFNSLGQSILAASDATHQSNIMLPRESVDDDLLVDWTQPQKNSVLRYNAYSDANPDKPLPPPAPVPKDSIPPFILQMFTYAPTLMQIILGSYDAQEALQNADPSGVAINNGAMQSSVAAEPYSVNFSIGLTRMAEINLKLMPVVYGTPRTIPVQGRNGETQKKTVNSGQNDGVPLDYKPTDMLISIEPGPSIGAQKQALAQQLINLAQVLPNVNAFLNAKPEVILDGLEGVSADKIRALYAEYQEESGQAQQTQQEMQQQQMQLNMEMLEAQVKKVTNEAIAAIMNAQTNAKKVDNQESQYVADMIIDAELQEKDLEQQRTENKIQIGKMLNERARTHLEAEKSKIAGKHQMIGHLLTNKKMNNEHHKNNAAHVLAAMQLASATQQPQMSGQEQPQSE